MKGFLFSLIFAFGLSASAEVLLIESILDHDTILAHTGQRTETGRVLAIWSRTSPSGIIGFGTVTSFVPAKGGGFNVRVHVLRMSRYDLALPGDRLQELDLKTVTSDYQGHAELLVRDRWKNISAKYRPLFIQSFSIGETAETLSDGEYLIGVYGNASYGITRNFSIGAILPGYFLNSQNGNAKLRVYQNDNDTVSIGSTVTRIRDSDRTAVNLNFFWDSVTSDHMISHTLITFAAATLERQQDTVAVKTAGTSSLQTGYEVILGNWDRVLFGPNYNFESKSVGGYLAYTRIWDRLHFSAFLQTVDIRRLQYSPQTGYVAFFEAYWRF